MTSVAKNSLLRRQAISVKAEEVHVNIILSVAKLLRSIIAPGALSVFVRVRNRTQRQPRVILHIQRTFIFEQAQAEPDLLASSKGDELLVGVTLGRD